jgi:hypothetical protein
MDPKNRSRAGTSPKITLPVNTSRSLPNSPPQADSILGSPPKGSPPSHSPFTYGLIPVNTSATSPVSSGPPSPNSSSKVDNISQLQGAGLGPDQRKNRVVKPVSAPSPPRSNNTSSSPPTESLLSSPKAFQYVSGEILLNQTNNLSKLRAQSRSVGNIPIVTGGSFKPITRSGRSNRWVKIFLHPFLAKRAYSFLPFSLSIFLRTSPRHDSFSFQNLTSLSTLHSSGNDSNDDEIPGTASGSNSSGRISSNSANLVNLLDVLALEEEGDDDQPVILSSSQVRFQREVVVPELPLSSLDQDDTKNSGGSHLELNHRKEKPPTKRFALNSKGEERRTMTPITPRSTSGLVGSGSNGSLSSREGDRSTPTTPTSGERLRKSSSVKNVSHITTSPPSTPTSKSKSSNIIPTLTGLYSSINNLTSPVTSPVVSPRGEKEISPPISPPVLRKNSTTSQLTNLLNSSSGSIKPPAPPPVTDVLNQHFRKSLVTTDGAMEVSTVQDLSTTAFVPQLQLLQQLKGATFPKLVAWLLFYISGEEDTDEMEIRSFLCTYRDFASPTVLFNLIVKYFKMYCRAKTETQKSNRALINYQGRLKKRYEHEHFIFPFFAPLFLSSHNS